jgi:hypothetical protein
MDSLVDKVATRLSEMDNTPKLSSTSINRAIELSDFFVKVTPQEYILPLNLFSEAPRPTAVLGEGHLK